MWLNLQVSEENTQADQNALYGNHGAIINILPTNRFVGCENNE